MEVIVDWGDRLDRNANVFACMMLWMNCSSTNIPSRILYVFKQYHHAVFSTSVVTPHITLISMCSEMNVNSNVPYFIRLIDISNVLVRGGVKFQWSVSCLLYIKASIHAKTTILPQVSYGVEKYEHSTTHRYN